MDPRTRDVLDREYVKQVTKMPELQAVTEDSSIMKELGIVFNDVSRTRTPFK